MPMYRNKEAGEGARSFLLDLYIYKLPDEAKEADLFYCQPLQFFLPKANIGILNNRGVSTP